MAKLYLHNEARGSPWLFFLTCCLSHLAYIPGVLEVHRQQLVFETSVGAFTALVSFMYHVCESFDTRIFLTELRWHRLDNICAITAISVANIHLSCFDSFIVRDYFKLLFFLTAIVLQEKDPWNVRYTVVPVAVSLLFPVLSHWIWPKRRLRLKLRGLAFGAFFFGIAFPFFIAGLDDGNDPYRMYHGLWHLFGGIGMYYLWTSVRNYNCPPNGSTVIPPPLSMRSIV